jgi:hypothetical protein
MAIIVWPEYITLKNWAGALLEQYPRESLPMLIDENKWEEWAAVVSTTGPFLRLSIPTPVAIKEGQRVSSFNNWQEWAKVFYNIVMSQSKQNVKI